MSICAQGRFTIAAKHHITIAEIYETELVDIEKVSRGGGDHCRCPGQCLGELTASFEECGQLLWEPPLQACGW